MFYLKERALIQRHHTSTEKKCCLISVTPLLLLSSSSGRERERLCATLATQTASLLRVSVCLSDLKKNVQIIMDSLRVAMGWTQTPECQSTRIENIMQCKNTPFQMFTTRRKCSVNVGGKAGKCSTFAVSASEWKGGEVRRDKDRHYFGGWLACLLSSAVIDRLVQRLHSHGCHHTHFPQKSVYQHCLSRATAMTSNHRRAGTS